MAATISSSKSRTATDLQLSNKWKERETSPERNKVWTEPPSGKHKADRKVSVVYYLSRNGQLEHPHFLEVPLSSSSSEGLYLRDVINRLNVLRGKGMASMYSWSSKRSYKNGFVWHDLGENDFIYPAHGQEYVLKGSVLLDDSLISKFDEVLSSSSEKPQPENRKPGENSDFAAVTRRRNQSWSSINLHEYKVYKAETAGEYSGRAAANASTQTEDKRRRRRVIREIEEEEKEMDENTEGPYESPSTELGRDEISPPPSDSSPETLESLMKSDGRLVMRAGETDDDPTPNNHTNGRAKASTMLMQLISCGSLSFMDCGPGYGKETHHNNPGFSLISHYKARLPRGGDAISNQNQKEDEVEDLPSLVGLRKMQVEDKEYFSGSLVETKKKEFPALKRSNSYNADRNSVMEEEVTQERMERESSKCIPRKQSRAQLFTRKEVKTTDYPSTSQ